MIQLPVSYTYRTSSPCSATKREPFPTSVRCRVDVLDVDFTRHALRLAYALALALHGWPAPTLALVVRGHSPPAGGHAVTRTRVRAIAHVRRAAGHSACCSTRRAIDARQLVLGPGHAQETPRPYTRYCSGHLQRSRPAVSRSTPRSGAPSARDHHPGCRKAARARSDR